MGWCKADRLPVYRVVRTGLERAEVDRLAEAFKLGHEQVAHRNGAASFLDEHNYLKVPMVKLEHPETLERFRASTTNHQEDRPIEVHAIDLEALDRIAPPTPAVATTRTASALADAKLVPDSARAVVDHRTFTVVLLDDDGNEREQRQTRLDTRVSHRFTLDGYRLIGPGAQVQVSYGAGGEVTRLLYATRAVEPGPSVAIIDAEAIAARLRCGLPHEAEIDLELVYLAPSLHRTVNAAADWNPSELLPWYAVKVTRQIADPGTGEPRPQISRIRYLLATDDRRFVPSVTIAAATTRNRTRVEASAEVTGGTAPYTFIWGGSNPEATSHLGDRASYEPQIRDLRRVLPSQSFARTEQVTVTVVDANGIAAEAATSLPVIAQPAPDTHKSVTYGCKSPDDPGAWTGDRVHWRAAMSVFGGGSERFCWLNDSSWPGDFIEPPVPGGTEPHPWINGDADYQNWGINTANIVFYIGDSNPWGLADMYPGASPSDYNTGSGGGLSVPGTGTTVSIGSQGYAVNYTGNWGAPHPGDRLQWLAMYACNLLERSSSAGDPWNRWGPAFNGLHSLMAFQTEAGDNNDFCSDFPFNFLGFAFWRPTTVVQAWISAADAHGIGTPAAMGPMTRTTVEGATHWVSDFGDYYWGRGPVGPTIPRSQINGWWYVQ
jgi:hypothetical protein